MILSPQGFDARENLVTPVPLAEAVSLAVHPDVVSGPPPLPPLASSPLPHPTVSYD